MSSKPASLSASIRVPVVIGSKVRTAPDWSVTVMVGMSPLNLKDKLVIGTD